MENVKINHFGGLECPLMRYIMAQPKNAPRLPRQTKQNYSRYETNPYSIHNHSPIKGLGKLSPFYCSSWNSEVTNYLREEGIDNICWYDEFTATEYNPAEMEDIFHVYQFEQINRKCHRCQKVKNDMWWTPIRNGAMMGTPQEATVGILKAIATNAFCALCAIQVGL